MSLQLLATRVHSGPADGLQPFPSLHLPTYRLVRQLPQSAFDRIICFSSAVHVFVLCQLQKTHFSFFSPSCFPCLLLASLCGVGGQRECGFNQRAGQPPPLMIHSTSRLTEERGRGGWVKQSAGWFQLRFAQKATSIWQQTAQAVLAGRSTLLPHARTGRHSAFYTERER